MAKFTDLNLSFTENKSLTNSNDTYELHSRMHWINESEEDRDKRIISDLTEENFIIEVEKTINDSSLFNKFLKLFK